MQPRPFRTGGFVDSAVEADAAFPALIEQSRPVIPIANRDLDLARRLLSNHRTGLRAGDALHLAIISHGAARSGSGLDETMIAIGRSLGPPMETGFPATI